MHYDATSWLGRLKLRSFLATFKPPHMQALLATNSMIYVEDRSFDNRLKLLDYLSSNEELYLVAWLYPESNLKKLLNLDLVRSDLKPVTTYGDGFQPWHTEPKRCTSELLARLFSLRDVLTKNCDSLALYRENESSWDFCTIGHEGMSLIADDRLLDDVRKAGFQASLQAPSWW